MSGDQLAARMDAMHEAWNAMEQHILEKFETFALGYGLDLSLNEKQQWADLTTNAASTAFFNGYCQRHEEQKKAYDVSNVRLTADNAALLDDNVRIALERDSLRELLQSYKHRLDARWREGTRVDSYARGYQDGLEAAEVIFDDLIKAAIESQHDAT